MPEAAAILEDFRSKGARVQPLLKLLLSAVGAKLDTASRQAFVLNIVRTVALGASQSVPLP